ncbi:unnamed protein product [Phytophthora fragariaefolia]|uniref:Unnamed protein product n=1 Tax=Phytophthora fragariaefolia TaxID=1490495 RepID=A0A9W6XK66_9STRA|nr:unnamed protein product [Phytophthora fragariaefolia]
MSAADDVVHQVVRVVDVRQVDSELVAIDDRPQLDCAYLVHVNGAAVRRAAHLVAVYCIAEHLKIVGEVHTGPAVQYPGAHVRADGIASVTLAAALSPLLSLFVQFALKCPTSPRTRLCFSDAGNKSIASSPLTTTSVIWNSATTTASCTSSSVTANSVVMVDCASFVLDCKGDELSCLLEVVGGL